MKKKAKIRLYLNQDLSCGIQIELDESRAHYLINVMKQVSGDNFLAFDNKNGEFECAIQECSRKKCSVKVLSKTRDYEKCPDIWLLFAPVKKDQTDFIIQKATELGCSKIIPVITARTIAEKTKTERFIAQSIEACEQCRRVDLPMIAEATEFNKLLKDWDKNRHLYFMDETGNGENIFKVFSSSSGTAAILVGPEGGFAEEELNLLRKLDFATGTMMGKRILRAETAVAAALACWQAVAGDWNKD